MKKTPILFAFYVSGGAARLIKLLKKNSAILENTALVINDNAPNESLETLLKKRKIQHAGINYKDLGLTADQKNQYLSKMMLKKFKERKIDYCFCFGGRILKGELLNIYKNKIINFHPSILPTFPGIKSIDQATEKNSFLLGNTAHFIDQGVDTGPIIMQSVIHSKRYSTYDDVLDMQLPMVEQIYRWIVGDRLVVVGDKVVVKNADYFKQVFYPTLEIK